MFYIYYFSFYRAFYCLPFNLIVTYGTEKIKHNYNWIQSVEMCLRYENVSHIIISVGGTAWSC